MRTFPSLVLVCLPVLVAPVALAGPTEPTRTTASVASAFTDGTTGSARSSAGSGADDVPQTSDGVQGPIARPRSVSARGAGDVSIRRHWQVAPGITATSWDESDKRGPVRAHLLSIDWTQRGVGIDYGNAGRVRQTAPLSTILRRDQAIAGVNGDFFDIGDTGAPLGIGRDRQRGLLHGRYTGWNSAFSFDAGGVPQIGPLQVITSIKERPGLKIANVNSPSVAIGGIGLYTPAWGRTSGNRVVDGQTTKVRMVHVRNGKVVHNKTRLPSGTVIKGRMLIGRGDGAFALRALKVGTKVTFLPRLVGASKMAITGNQFLIDEGIVKVVDDRELHPRTAIGIDRDMHRILLLVIDGRQRFSRGYTMVELAEMMMELGADEALNLDGGGSSTMIARRPNGNVKVINSPSDGVERSVPNGVSITYRAP
ncbi:phosphodiester glycosidase family protein [Nocardioides sp.]|uniref:phosphodiester glycosidase family protein n=1 Tax=Nocardioides sp. TaxID=35761 RepID=UPI002B27297C|nr:phosphodiester glycosidase family protein [Nocardioides sp.]